LRLVGKRENSEGDTPDLSDERKPCQYFQAVLFFILQKGNPRSAVEGFNQLESFPRNVVEGFNQLESLPRNVVEGFNQLESLPRIVVEGFN